MLLTVRAGELVALSNGVGDPIVVDCVADPRSCHCPGSVAFPCPPNTGGQNIWGPGGDHAFTLVVPVATDVE